MTALADLVAGRIPPGIYAWREADPADDARETVELAGWRLVHLDAAGTRSKPAFLETVGRALGFPDHYGRNFDALADLLAEARTEPAAGVVLLWDGWGAFARADGASFGTALRVLRTRVEDLRGGPFAVLLRGDGPVPPGVTDLG